MRRGRKFADAHVAGEQAPPPLPPPCGKRIRFPAEIVLIGSSRWLRPSRAHPEAEGTDSPPHLSFSDSAEILWISGRGICKEAIFSPGGKPPLRKNQRPGRPSEIFDFAWSVAKRLACPLGKQPFRRAGRRPRLKVERVHTLSSSPGGCSGGDFGFRRSRFVLLWTLFPTTRGVGRSAPLHPLGGRVREGCAPSRARRGGGRTEIFGWAREVFFSCFFFIAVLAKDFVSDDAGVGRAAPLHPLG